MKQFTNLVADNVDFDILSLCKHFWELHHYPPAFQPPVLKGRIGGEDGHDVTIYLNKVLTKDTVLIASKDAYEELKVSDLSYGNLFSSNNKGAYCLKSRCWFDGENKLLEIFLSEEEAKFATKSSIRRFKTLEAAKKAFDGEGEKYFGKYDHELIEVNGQKVFLCGTCIPYEDIIYPAFEDLKEKLYKQFPELESLNVDLDSSELRDYYLELLSKEGVRFEEVYDEF